MSHPRAHPHAIHCLHVRGWHQRQWCRSCFNHWQDTCAKLYCKAYEKLADANLIHAIFTELEDGELPIPAEILNLDLSGLGIDEPHPSHEPSAN